MTLTAYPAIAVGMDPGTAQPVSNFPWRHVHASRFCPACLAANGGRWKLAWRMVWFFACPIHRCLLADHCPECAGAQRGRSVSALVPRPGRCTCRATADEATSDLSQCGADLTAARVTRLDQGHPVLAAQATIAEAIIENKTCVGIYRGMSYPVTQVLTDIGVLGRYVLHDADPPILSALVSPDIVAEYLSLPAPARNPGRRPPDRASPAVRRHTVDAGAGQRQSGQELERRIPLVGFAGDASRCQTDEHGRHCRHSSVATAHER